MYQPLNIPTTLPLRNSIGRSPWWRGLRLTGLTLAVIALSPPVQAVSPPPDGGYPGFNTAVGTDALFSLTSGISNTALGYNALFSNTTGSSNTATGNRALGATPPAAPTRPPVSGALCNTFGNDNTATGSMRFFATRRHSQHGHRYLMRSNRNTTQRIPQHSQRC